MYCCEPVGLPPDNGLPANASDTLTLGLTLNATDVITVYASTATMSFAAFGSEIA